MGETRQCPECGHQAVVFRGYTHTTAVAGIRVNDATAMAWVCGKCGFADLTADQISGYERRAAALVLRDGRHGTGPVLRFGRKALGLKQEELGLLLATAGETISRYENGKLEIPRAVQLALVALLDGVERGTEDVKQQVDKVKSGRVSDSTLEVPLPPQRKAVCG